MTVREKNQCVWIGVCGHGVLQHRTQSLKCFCFHVKILYGIRQIYRVVLYKWPEFHKEILIADTEQIGASDGNGKMVCAFSGASL